MANTLGSVEIDLIARVGRLERDMDKAQQTVKKKTGGMASAAQKNMSLISNAFKGLAVGFLVREVVKLSDAWTNQQSLLRNVATEGESLADTQDRLFRIAQSTRVNLDATVLLYSRLAQGTKDLGFAQSDLYTIVELVNKTVAISGSTAIEAENAIRQFTQGIASNRLGGEELRSVLEQLPSLAQALADGLGVPVGKLRELGAQGVLSAETVAKALIKMKDDIDQRFGNVNQTVGQSFTQLDNSAGRFIGTAMGASEAGSGLAMVISGLAGTVDFFTDRLIDAQFALSEFLSPSAEGDIRRYEEVTEAVLEQKRHVEALIKVYGESSDAVTNERIRLAELNEERGRVIANLQKTGQDLSALTEKYREHTSEGGNLAEALSDIVSEFLALEGQAANTASQLTIVNRDLIGLNDAGSVLNQTMPATVGLMGDFNDLMAQAPSKIEPTESAVTALRYAMGGNLAEGLSGAISNALGRMSEFGQYVTTQGTPALSGLIAEFEDATDPISGMVSEVEVLNGKLESLSDIAKGMAGLFDAVFAGADGRTGQIARGISQVANAVGALADSSDALSAAIGGANFGGGLAQAAGLGPSGQLGAQVGGAIGAAIGYYFGQSTGAQIGAVIGSTVGGAASSDYGEQNTRIQINTGTALSAAEMGADPRFFRRTALGASVSGHMITQITDGQTILDGIVRLDSMFADIASLTDLVSIDDLLRASGAMDPGGNLSPIYENASAEDILLDRFNRLMGAFDERVRGLVGPVQDFTDGLDRLNAAVTIVSALDTDLETIYGDIRDAANRTVIGIVEDSAQNVTDMVDEFDGSTRSLRNLAGSITELQKASVQALAAIDAAMQQVSDITAGSIQSMEFRLLGMQDTSGESQFNFLVGRAEQLAAGIGDMSDPATISRTVDQINSMIMQAFNMIDDPERAAALFQQFSGFLTGVDSDAQTALEAAREEVKDLYTKAMEDVRDIIGEGMAKFGTEAASISNSAGTMYEAAQLFNSGAQQFDYTAANFSVTVEFDSGQVNAAA